MNMTHTVPTHVNMQEKIGVGHFTLTPRQVFYVIIAFAVGYRIWRGDTWLVPLGVTGLVVRVVLSVLPIVALLLIGTKTLAGRTIEIWLLLWLLFLTHPGQMAWVSVLREDRFAISEKVREA